MQPHTTWRGPGLVALQYNLGTVNSVIAIYDHFRHNVTIYLDCYRIKMWIQFLYCTVPVLYNLMRIH
jgi:hypothetical protein